VQYYSSRLYAIYSLRNVVSAQVHVVKIEPEFSYGHIKNQKGPIQMDDKKKKKNNLAFLHPDFTISLTDLQSHLILVKLASK